MSEHGNSKQNKKLQHLYGIYEWESNALFKYGISAGKIGSDGMSKRMRIQVTFLNLGAGFNKFYAKILLAGISGRAAAERIEQEHIDAYSEKHGQKPPGNIR